MNIEQALNIIHPKGNSLDDLKMAYRIACKKYHPDINPDGLELMKLINTAHDFLKAHVNQWTYTQTSNSQGIDEILQEIFDKIKHLDGIKAEICGCWLWISGETRTHKAYLKEIKLRYAPKKKKWYWRPEGYKKKSKRVFSMNEIRLTFGSIDLEQQPSSAIA